MTGSCLHLNNAVYSLNQNTIRSENDSNNNKINISYSCGNEVSVLNNNNFYDNDFSQNGGSGLLQSNIQMYGCNLFGYSSINAYGSNAYIESCTLENQVNLDVTECRNEQYIRGRFIGRRNWTNTIYLKDEFRGEINLETGHSDLVKCFTVFGNYIYLNWAYVYNVTVNDTTGLTAGNNFTTDSGSAGKIIRIIDGTTMEISSGSLYNTQPNTATTITDTDSIITVNVTNMFRYSADFSINETIVNYTTESGALYIKDDNGYKVIDYNNGTNDLSQFPTWSLNIGLSSGSKIVTSSDNNTYFMDTGYIDFRESQDKHWTV